MREVFGRRPEVFFSPLDARNARGGVKPETELLKSGTFQEVSKEFIARLPLIPKKDGKHLSPATVEAYGADISQVQEVLGEKWQNAQFVSVLSQLPGVLSELALGKNMTGKSVGRKRAAVSRFVQWAENEGYLPDGSADTFKSKTEEYHGGTGVEKKQKSKGRVLSSEEILAIKERTRADKDERMSALIRVMLATGRANHEVLALRSGDIIFTEDTEVLMKFQNKDGKMQFVHVDLDTKLLLLKLKKGKDDSSALFTRQVRKGVNPEKSLTRQGGWVVFKGFAQRAGVEKFSSQDLLLTARVKFAREHPEKGDWEIAERFNVNLQKAASIKARANS